MTKSEQFCICNIHNTTLYSARADLGLAGVTAQHWRQVLDTASTDEDMFRKLVIFYNQNHWSGNLPDMAAFLCRDVWNIECPYV